MSKHSQSKSKHDKAQERRSERVEMITLGVSILILLVLFSLVIYEALGRDGGPVVLHVEPALEEIRQQEGLYYLPVQVSNESSHTATEVTITFTLRGEQGEAETAALAIPLLAGEATIRGVVAFRQAPTAGNLRHVLSYIDP